MLRWLAGHWGGVWQGAAKALLVVAAAIVLYRLGRAAINRVLIRGRVGQRFLDKRRVDTLASTLTSLLRYTMYFLVLGTILPLAGVNVNALIAAAGIGGVAIAFGAQHLIKDVINGFFILLEGSLAVGDLVVVAGVTGVVEEAGLRVTRVRDAEGRLHVIPNGQIVQVTNLSAVTRAGQVDLPVGPRSDLAALEELARRTCDAFAAEHPELTDGPKLVGVWATATGTVLRVSFKSGAGMPEPLEAELRRALYLAVTAAGLRWRVR